MRTHASSAKSHRAKLDALSSFMPLWRVVHRLSQRFGLLPGTAPLALWRQLTPLTDDQKRLFFTTPYASRYAATWEPHSERTCLFVWGFVCVRALNT